MMNRPIFPAAGRNRGRSPLALTALVLLLSSTVAACEQGQTEKWARDSIAAAKGFIEQAQTHHGEECRAACQLASVQDPAKCARICNAINRAVHAQNLAIDALNLYCAGPGWAEGGACSAQPALEPRVREAIRELNRILADAKGALQ